MLKGSEDRARGGEGRARDSYTLHSGKPCLVISIEVPLHPLMPMNKAIQKKGEGVKGGENKLIMA